MKNTTRMILIGLLIIGFAVALHNEKAVAAGFSPDCTAAGLKTGKITKESIKITWKKQIGASGYCVYLASSKNGKYEKISKTKDNSYTAINLKPGTVFYFRVRAYKKEDGKIIYGKYSKVLKASTKDSGLQALDYSECTDEILNPEQGFYTPLYVTMKPDGLYYKKEIINDKTRLYHLRIDIGSFSKANNKNMDLPLSETALKELEKLLYYLYYKDKNAIVRFAYDPGFGGKKDREPSQEQMKEHIDQLCPILNKYSDVITAIEVGMVGPWGEMHSSSITKKPDTINKLTGEFLNKTYDIPILVRTPQMIYNYLGITKNDIASYTISPENEAYRLGIFNDGYLGSSSDLGTYSSRSKEIPWLAKQTAHLPYGGEVTVPQSPLHDIDKCLPEMFELHLSYLNKQWNDQVVKKWKTTKYTEKCGDDEQYYGKSAFQYIENHMGYRLVLTSSVIDVNSGLKEMTISLNIKNTGFGNLNRKKRISILFVDSDGNITRKNAGIYSGEEIINCKVPVPSAKGTYKVYLRIDNGKGKYAVRFANNLWRQKYKANLIGKISV